jgi:hypothetical protein
VVHATATVNAQRSTVVVVTHDVGVGEALGRAVATATQESVPGARRSGLAVVAGDATVQVPPEVLGESRFAVDRVDGRVAFVPGGERETWAGRRAPPIVGGP